MSKISVIIPVYNAEAYLSACLKSLTEQTFDDYEIIIVNDGSTDNSQSVIDDFAKRSDRIKSFILKNGGVSKARNFGMSVADGEYIVFVDADDDVSQDFLKKLYENGEDGYLTLCGFNKIYLNGKAEYREIWRLNENGGIVKTCGFYEVYAKWLFNSPCNKLYVKSIIDKYGITFKKGLNIGEDFIFNAEYILKSGIKSFTVVNEPLYNYYVRNVESNSTRFDETVCEKVLEHRDYVLECMSGFAVTDEERKKIDSSFLLQINEFLYIKLNAKQMSTALKNEKLITFLTQTADDEYKALIVRGEYKKARRKYRIRRKIANVKAKIRGVR